MTDSIEIYSPESKAGDKPSSSTIEVLYFKSYLEVSPSPHEKPKPIQNEVRVRAPVLADTMKGIQAGAILAGIAPSLAAAQSNFRASP